MKIAFMFPGQGSQYIGMGRDLYEKYDEVKKIYNRASLATNIDVATLCFNGIRRNYDDSQSLLDENKIGEDLNKTENTQIAIATMSLSILEVLKKENIIADIAVGLSLGEYPALIYGGAIDFEDGLKLLKQRGYLMGNRIPNENYSMAAVIGMQSTKIEEICNNLQKQGMFVVPANYNYSEQTVISGLSDAVDKATEILQNAGAKRVMKLQTSGPFHTSKLMQAKNEYENSLKEIEFKIPNIKVIKNLDGTFYEKEDNIKQILANHIISSVRFDKAINLMKASKIDTYIEIGPGKALSGFIKKELTDARVFNVFNCETLDKLLSELNNKGE